MKTFLMFGLIVFSGALSAETVTSRIHSIEEGIVKFENGRAGFISNIDLSDLVGSEVVAELDDQSNVISVNKAISTASYNFLVEPIYVQGPPTSSFVPTQVKGNAEALKIFNSMNPRYKRISECTDRAHVWAFDEFKRSGTKSEKVFALFTASYINRVRFKWWFHVAPLFTVNNGGNIEKQVMDFRYSPAPESIREWTNKLVFSKRACKPTEKFSEYDVNPQTEDCYLMVVPMHYRLPAEIFDREPQRQNRYKVGTSEAELAASKRYAF